MTRSTETGLAVGRKVYFLRAGSGRGPSGPNSPFELRADVGVAGLEVGGAFERGAGRDGPVQQRLVLVDLEIDVGEGVVGLGVVPLGGLAVEQERTDQLPLVLAELAAEEVGHAEVGVELEGLLNGLLGLLRLAGVVEELGVVTPDRRLVGVGLGQFLDRGRGGLVLPRAFELERLLDLGVIGSAAPLELLAAAARAGDVGIEGHRWNLVVGGCS